MYRIRGIASLVLLLFSCTGYDAHAVQAVVSHAIFYKVSPLGKDSAIIEVYWQVDPASLHYRRDANGLASAAIHTEVELTNEVGVALHQDKFLYNTRPLPDTLLAANSIAELRRYTINPGKATIRFALSEDGFPQADYHTTETIDATIPQKPWYSSLQLLDTVVHNNAPSSFLKDGMLQIPHILPFYDDGQHRLIFTTQLYGANTIASTAYPLIQRFFVTSKNSNAPIAGLIARDTLFTPPTIGSYFHTFSIAGLSSGNYYLRAELVDKAGTSLATAQTFFQTINKNPIIAANQPDTSTAPEKVSVFDLSKTFVAKYTPAQVRAMLKMISPRATPDEMIAINGFLRTPDEMYSRYFLYNFFSHRYSNAEKGWKSYSDTVRIVNKLFSTGSILGYETDRGIIYLKYGPPTERITVPNESGALPYEIWSYKSTTGNDEGAFLFYQPGFAGGSMVLLHSTLTTERHNVEWRRALYTTGRAGGSGNSRAEEYLGNR